MKIVSWNVNSIRARQERLEAFLERHDPDVVCLQETKVQDDVFPLSRLEELGYRCAILGQRTYNGVAIVSRHPLEQVVRGIPDDVDDPQSRLIAATVSGIRVINVYVPNGSSVGSDKFAYKLTWLERLRTWLAQEVAAHPALLVCGDFNIAPEDRDVYDPEVWRGKVLFHPDEHRAFAALQALGLSDAFRLHHEEPGHYSWWDYRAGMFRRGLGLRIDHFLVSAPLVESCTGVEIDRAERKGKGASDHAPVIASFANRT